MALLQLLFLGAIILETSHASFVSTPHQIHLLRPRSGMAGQHVQGINCLSWRLGVETNNVVKWVTIPKQCAGYVGHYMLGQQYRDDSMAVTGVAISYVESVELAGDGKDMWVFDVDETTLSNLPYFVVHGFGSEPYNPTSFNQWVLGGKAPALPASLKLYCKLLSLGVKVAFLTGRTEDQRSATAANLKHVGYYTWEKLILKGSSYSGKTSAFYKSSERGKLEEEGYRIIGNIGDQWSDVLGTNTGNRTFKLPDPMYYIS
ncbi:hypothetical protein K2173_024725 [Erythroxylum novogranatense]|uniref:Acid phosphatase n=1 Tax=Erythroxylum novogranatense TaxID=1862640 RepID=A0AAV8SVE0_9ROSI|nr:hypothetical protein K2173_024725 [Erythroxylum novogranatense]